MSETAKHTSGPWIQGAMVSGGKPALAIDIWSHKPMKGLAVVQMDSGMKMTSEETHANAKLITASPDLLEACKAFDLWLRAEEEPMSLPEGVTRDGSEEGERLWREWFNGKMAMCDTAQTLVRAAITKAEATP